LNAGCPIHAVTEIEPNKTNTKRHHEDVEGKINVRGNKGHPRGRGGIGGRVTEKKTSELGCWWDSAKKAGNGKRFEWPSTLKLKKEVQSREWTK